VLVGAVTIAALVFHGWSRGQLDAVVVLATTQRTPIAARRPGRAGSTRMSGGSPRVSPAPAFS
jgi:hypothetical protein